MSPSRDYHDYFIKDGRFIGAFEEMYQNVEDPWHIDALGRRLDMDAALTLLRPSGRKFDRVLDVGCGKGLFTALLAEVVGGKIFACDVSPTAVQEANRKNHDSRMKFFVFDLEKIEDLPFPTGFFDLIVMAQTIWCILPSLKKILRFFRTYLTHSGSLLISQHFLKPDEQKYGRELLAGPEDLLRMLEEAGFQIEATLETNRFSNHHLALLARPRD